ncbi:MAG: hypothetical protein AAGA77_15960 [Bacteroidota bacterium]
MNAIKKNASDNQIKRIPTIQDNFGLTKTEFNVYVQRLSLGDESLFTKVFRTHFHDSVAYLRLKFKISQEKAYDVCMDTMLDFRRKLVEGKIQYGNLRYLFTRMALNNYIDGIRKIQKTEKAIEIFMSDNNCDYPDKQLFFDIIDQTLEAQDGDSKKIIEDLFYIGKHVNQLADESGVSNATMRKRKQRVIDKMKNTFFDILKSGKS